MVIILVLLVLFSHSVWAGTISRPAKTFGGTSFINGVVPQASDFNGDIDLIYNEFNGNIDNDNIKSSAQISATKINPDGFAVNVRTANSAPCKVLDETDQPADARRWGLCVSSGKLQFGTYSDLGVLQNTWLTLDRPSGGFILGGTSGTNTINGTTTFNQPVTFFSSTNLLPSGTVMMFMGTSAPSGWLVMDGATHSCTGSSSVNAGLCSQLVGLYPTANYKGTAAGTFTVDTTSNEIIHAAHGRAVGDRVHFTSSSTLPTPLLNNVVYCILSVTTDRYKVSTTCGGSEVDITSTGAGTHSDYFNFVVPDARGRNPLGTGVTTATESGGDAEVDVAPSYLYVPSNNNKWITGMLVNFTLSSGTIGGLTSGSNYYVIRVNNFAIRLASNLSNAQNGIHITFTSKSSPSWKITYTTYNHQIGEVGGEEAHAMNSNEILMHGHLVNNVWMGSGGSANPSGVGASNVGSPGTSTFGGNSHMNIMDPFFAVNFIIKL